jgi:hypothetical protein
VSRPKQLPSADLVRSLLDYSTESGALTWREKTAETCADDQARNRWNKLIAGKEAGYIGALGYRQISVNGRAYYAHRLAWLHVHGDVPVEIDHIDRDKDNNRIANLRASDRVQNLRNIPAYRSNTSGLPGVHFRKDNELWAARISDHPKRLVLGCFETLFDAACARRRAEINLGFPERTI